LYLKGDQFLGMYPIVF